MYLRRQAGETGGGVAMGSEAGGSRGGTEGLRIRKGRRGGCCKRVKRISVVCTEVRAAWQ